MPASLVMALVFGMTGSPIQTLSGPEAITIMREACVDSGMQRRALEQWARTNRWRSVRMTQQSGATGWTDAYRASGALIMLMEGAEPVVSDAADVGTLCSISLDRAGENLDGELASFATSLDLRTAGAATTEPTMGKLQTWSGSQGLTLSYAAAPGDPRVVISLSRQIVTHEPAAVSPTGI